MNNLYSKILLIIFIGTFTLTNAQTEEIKFKTFSIKDGLSQSSVNSIIQDHKGFMWFGTQDGLNLYDGHSFKVYVNDLNDSSSLSNSFIRQIIESSDHKIWLATERGLCVYEREKNSFTNYLHEEQDKNSINHNSIFAIHEDQQQSLWIGTEKGLNLYLKNKKVFLRIPVRIDDKTSQFKITSLSEADENHLWIGTEEMGLIYFNTTKKEAEKIFPIQSVTSLKKIKTQLWVGTSKGIYLIDNQTLSPIPLPNKILLSDLAKKEIKVIATDVNNTIWIGTNLDGLYHYNPKLKQLQQFVNEPNNNYSIANNGVYSFCNDSSGIIWIGTNNGISKFEPKKQYFHHIRVTEENSLLSDANIWSIFKDNDGTLWVGNSSGIDHINLKNNTKTLYVPNISHSSKQKTVYVFNAFRDRKNVLWFGTDAGLYFFNENKNTLEHFKFSGEANEDRVYRIIEDRSGQLWLATKNGIVRISSDRKSWIRYNKSENSEKGISSNFIRVIAEDNKGNLWAGGDASGLIKITNPSSTPEFKVFKSSVNNPHSLSNNTVLCLHADADNVLWIGTFGGGFNKLDLATEKFERFTQKNGLSNNVVYGILEDEKQNLWMSTNKGISRFNKKTEEFSVFEETDGLQSNEFNTGAYYKDQNGLLYFGGINGVSYFKSSDIVINTIPPKMVLTSLLFFNKKEYAYEKKILDRHISETQHIDITYKDNVFTIEFAALHFSAPEKNQLAYKLEGFNEDYIYCENFGKADYTNLEDGDYTFYVKGANSDGVWTEEIPILKITIHPPLWRTWWFRTIMIIVALLCGYLFYISRIKQIKNQKLALEKLVNARTKEVIEQKEKIQLQNAELEKEKEKTEQLLLNILPPDTVGELKSKGKASARSYRTVSVLLADVKGFTRISEKLRPKQLVAQLDAYFIKFDEILERHNMEKIKTMGDAYMCAGGLPIRNKSNPIDAVLAGLKIQEFVKDYNSKKGGVPWEFRIGIHTGDLVAGVVGIKKFAYDIWGDTVNVTKRIETAGEVGRVNISGETYDKVKDFFDFEFRGKIDAKNKGTIDMYFVNAIKEELSVDGLGKEPNEKFWKYVDLHLYSKINYRKAEKYIISLLEEKLPNNLHYHSIEHTLDVCNAVEKIALNEGLVGEDVFLLKTAALYHDSGFVEIYEQNESIGAHLAEEALPKFGYTKEEIEVVKQLILATRVPHNPKNKLEEIICDADLDYLGRDDFFRIGDKLKLELMERKKVKSDKEWDELQVKFLSHHQFFTASSIKNRQPKKEQNLQAIKERLKSYS